MTWRSSPSKTLKRQGGERKQPEENELKRNWVWTAGEEGDLSGVTLLAVRIKEVIRLLLQPLGEDACAQWDIELP